MKTKIGCIGGGNIVRAILSGTKLSGNYQPGEIGIFDINDDVRKMFNDKGYVTYGSIGELVSNSQIVVIAILPQIIRKIIPEIKAVYSDQNIFISLPAGIKNDWFYENLGDDAKVVQCVPTLTAQVGMGAYSVNRAKAVTDADYKLAHDFLTSSGIVAEIPEDLMQEVIPFAGAAPAYFYHIADVVVQEGVKMGLDEKTVLQLFAETMKGSAEMLMTSEDSPKTLEKKLLLPKAATLSAINKMVELGFDDAWRAGIKACVDQANNLAKL